MSYTDESWGIAMTTQTSDRSRHRIKRAQSWVPRKGMRRALASVIVLFGCGAFVLGNFSSPALALTISDRGHRGGTTSVIYGVVHGNDGPFTIVASHQERGRSVVDAKTLTADDGTYRIEFRTQRGPERIRVSSVKRGPRSSIVVRLRSGGTYRLDGLIRHHFGFWFFPIFSY